jgi:hypothetical protein
MSTRLETKPARSLAGWASCPALGEFDRAIGRRLGGLEALDHLDQFHHRHGVEEVHADDALAGALVGDLGGRGDLGDPEIELVLDARMAIGADGRVQVRIARLGGGDVHNKQPPGQADLGGGQPDALGVVHEFDHPVGDRPDVPTDLGVGHVDRLGPLPQDLGGVDNDVQRRRIDPGPGWGERGPGGFGRI